MSSGFPVIVILDRHKIGGRPFAAHWTVAYRVEDKTVYLANISVVGEEFGKHSATMPRYTRSRRILESADTCH